MPALAAGVAVRRRRHQSGWAGSSAIPEAWFADFNDVPAGQSLPRLRRAHGARRNHGGVPQRQLLPQRPRDARADGGLPAARQAQRWHTFLRRRPAPCSSTSPQTTSRPTGSSSSIARGSPAAARARSADRQPSAVLPQLAGCARPDGGLPSQGLRGRRATSRRPRPACSPTARWGIPARAAGSLDRGDRAVEGDRRLRQRELLPADPNTRGQMAVFMTKTFHRPEGDSLPGAGELGPERRRRRQRALASGYLPWMGAQYSLFNSAPRTWVLWPDSAPHTPVDCTSGHLPGQLHDATRCTPAST